MLVLDLLRLNGDTEPTTGGYDNLYKIVMTADKSWFSLDVIYIIFNRKDRVLATNSWTLK